MSTAVKILLNSVEAPGFGRKFGLLLENIILGLFKSKIKSISKASVSNVLAQVTPSLSDALSEVIEESKSLNQMKRGHVRRCLIPLHLAKIIS